MAGSNEKRVPGHIYKCWPYSLISIPDSMNGYQAWQNGSRYCLHYSRTLANVIKLLCNCLLVFCSQWCYIMYWCLHQGMFGMLFILYIT